MKPKKLGRYDIVAELGAGAMGTVYKGLDPKIQRTVALKVLNFKQIKQGSDNLQARERFMVEARATGQLSHPNILTIYDVGEEKGNAYIAMEFLHGGTLEDAMESNGFKDYDHIFDIVRQIAEGLSHAHSRNIIHRDVKPANIMMAEGKVPKIADFGLARFTDSNLTTTGTVLGTPNYMSPEQIRGRKIDGRSDLFALGIILYEMLTGEKPFAGDSITSVIYRVVNEEPIPPKQLNMDLPDYIDTFMARALAKNPASRFQTAEKFVEGMRGIMSDAHQTTVLEGVAPTKAKTVKLGRKKKKAAIAAGLSSSVAASAQSVLGAVQKKVGLPMYAIVGGALLIGFFFFSIIYSVMTGGKHELGKPVSKPVAEKKVKEAAAPPPIVTKAEKPAKVEQKPVEPVQKAVTGQQAKIGSAKKPAVKGKAKAVVKTALLSIRSRPTGANVYINGKLVGKTPYLKRKYKQRELSIKVAKKGYKEDAFKLNLKKNRELTVKLKKSAATSATALLSIRSKPTGADVYVNEELVGKTPYLKRRYKKRELSIRVSKKGYIDDAFEVNLKKDRELMALLSSEKTKAGFFDKMFKPGKAGNVGTLIVRAKEGDKVTVDGKSYKAFPVVLRNITIGKHNIFIVRKGKKPFLKTVTLKKGETLRIVPKF